MAPARTIPSRPTGSAPDVSSASVSPSGSTAAATRWPALAGTDHHAAFGVCRTRPNMTQHVSTVAAPA